MKRRVIDKSRFSEQYFTAVQTLALLADTQDLFCELGRGSGKTTHILGPRMDRVQNSMPGSVQVFLASTYKAIFENLVPGILEFFKEHYQENIYFCVGKQPPAHFNECRTPITSWHNTISFVNGTVIQFVSCERPEQANGKNIAHLYMDEMLHIKSRVYYENVLPSLRSKSTLMYNSPYFMGTTGTTSTPNIETDEDWFLDYQKQYKQPDMMERVRTIQRLALELDHRLYMLDKAEITGDADTVRKLKRYTARVEQTLTALRRHAVYYLHASSFSNIKVLGIDYIKKQISGTLDTASLNTSIFAVRENRVKDMFFCKFSPAYICSDTYKYERVEGLSIGSDVEFNCSDMCHCDLDSPLYIGYDPGPFTSMVVGQYSRDRRTFYILKNIYAYWPEQQTALVEQFNRFFAPMRCRTVFIHYDRAGNQRDPQWKRYEKYYGGSKDTDAITLRDQLQLKRWGVTLMSVGQRTIFYREHLQLLQRLFSGDTALRINGEQVIHILVDENECEALISSIYNSPIKRHAGDVELDKSSERLPFEEQAYNSTQLASALMYLLWGEFAKRYLPVSTTHSLNDLAGFTMGV